MIDSNQANGASDAAKISAIEFSSGAVAIIEPRSLIAECMIIALTHLDPDCRYLAFPNIDALKRSVPAKLSVILIESNIRNFDQHWSEISRYLSRERWEVKIVIISKDIDHISIKAHLDIGAKGIFPACSDLSLLPLVLRIVANRGIYIPPAIPFRGYPDGFNDIQRTISEKIALGMSNRTIANQLGVHEGVVKSRVRSMLKKSGATNRTELAVRILEMEIH